MKGVIIVFGGVFFNIYFELLKKRKGGKFVLLEELKLKKFKIMLVLKVVIFGKKIVILIKKVFFVKKVLILVGKGKKKGVSFGIDIECV